MDLDKRFEAVMQLDAQERYEFTIKQVADGEEIWFLIDEEGDFVLTADDDDLRFIPVWPAEEFAEACAREEWSDTRPASMDIEEFLLEAVPFFIKDDLQLAIFPLPDDGAQANTALLDFANDLNVCLAEDYDDGFELPYLEQETPELN